MSKRIKFSAATAGAMSGGPRRPVVGTAWDHGLQCTGESQKQMEDPPLPRRRRIDVALIRARGTELTRALVRRL